MILILFLNHRGFKTKWKFIKMLFTLQSRLQTKLYLHITVTEVLVNSCFEEMLPLLLSSSSCQDLHGAIKRVSSFLQCPLVDEEVNNCVQHCSFSTMKNNKMVNYTMVPDDIMDHSKGSFMRKGEALLYYMKVNQTWLLISVLCLTIFDSNVK